MPTELTLAHSPDPDDAFMFYALATERIDADGLRFQHVLADIETLNQKALRSTYDVTAISFHAYAYLRDRYRLLRCGASFGDGYGPLLVSRAPLAPADLGKKRVAVPGTLTSAYLLLKLFAPEVETTTMQFDRIPAAVAAGEAEAGLLIHEGQLTYAGAGLHKVVDLGEWWKQQTGLPVPLGGNAIRRDLEPELTQRIAAVLERSIRYALDHRPEALAHALQYGRGLSTELGDKFVGMYVNRWTLDCGPDGRRSIQLLLDRAHQAQLIPEPAKIEIVG
ncbi:MAG: ABC transporter substrate-binding protein [Acidobacteria bacterium]|nr:ABC transporter substrate-binding protein [Acidobacteriota bacterium]MCH8947498.1 ABC transporter substrate-binding protein [Acidobacteriota bacterium]